MSEYCWRLRCAICGKFVSYDADYCVMWGSYGDSEPPDPDYYCQKCVESEKEFYRKQGRPPSSYRPSNWEVDLAHELGYERAQYGWEKKEATNDPS